MEPHLYSREPNWHLSRILRTCRLSIVDYFILDDLYTGSHMRLSMLKKRVLQTAADAGVLPRQGMRAVVNRMQSLKRRRYIQEIDQAARKAIARIMEAAGLTPLSGVPFVGDIDLTLAGASIMEYVSRMSHGESRDSSIVYVAIEGADRIRPYIVSPSREACETYGERDPAVQLASGLTECGPWCGRWWRVYFGGFKRRIRAHRLISPHNS